MRLEASTWFGERRAPGAQLPPILTRVVAHAMADVLAHQQRRAPGRSQQLAPAAPLLLQSCSSRNNSIGRVPCARPKTGALRSWLQGNSPGRISASYRLIHPFFMNTG